MAITITERPRLFYYNDGGSPPTNVYSNWNAAWNPIVYIFSVLTADVASSVLLNIYEVGTNTLLASNTLRPFRSGDWHIDIAPYLKAYLFSTYSPNFASSDNYKDLGNSLSFYITYTQTYDQSPVALFNSEQARPIVACCSAKQFGDSNGGNMAQYVPFNFDLAESLKMKFLTAFERPVMFIGFPLTLSFIYSTNIGGVEVFKQETQQDINGTSLAIDDTILSDNHLGKINYLKINEPIQPNCQSILVSLFTGEPVDHTYVDEGYVDVGYTQIQ